MCFLFFSVAEYFLFYPKYYSFVEGSIMLGFRHTKSKTSLALPLARVPLCSGGRGGSCTFTGAEARHFGGNNFPKYGREWFGDTSSAQSRGNASAEKNFSSDWCPEHKDQKYQNEL